jgi:hypothetical protein
MTSTQRAICLLAIVTFGFIARAATTGAPILDHHSWRQADTAMIARNFAESRLNPLYPQVDHRGALPVGYVATGFELQALLVALISKVTGFSPQVGRLLSVLWYVGSALLVFALTRSRYGDAAGLSAAFIYSFGFPLVLFVERAFLNEALLLFLSFAVLVAVERRTHAGGRSWLLLAAAAMAVIGAVKPTFLIVAAGVLALYIERDGRRGLLSLEPYVLVSCGIIAATLWLSWAASLGRTTGLTFGLTDKLFDAATLFDYGYWVKVARQGSVRPDGHHRGDHWACHRMADTTPARDRPSPRRLRIPHHRDAGKLPSRLLPATAGHRRDGVGRAGSHVGPRRPGAVSDAHTPNSTGDPGGGLLAPANHHAPPKRISPQLV